MPAELASGSHAPRPTLGARAESETDVEPLGASAGREIAMPLASVGDIRMHYETEGSGDPLILIPYLSADCACYAFQTPEYSEHFTCVAVDLRGAGTTDKPAGPYSTEQAADDVVG
jgi:hypothetical protein